MRHTQSTIVWPSQDTKPQMNTSYTKGINDKYNENL